MVRDQLKRKLKELRKTEMAIRFKHAPMRAGARLIWNDFFSVKPDKPGHPPSVRYPFDLLLRMEREQMREVINDYFCFVYFQYYRENGLTIEDVYDPQLLARLGLPPSATGADIKRRFRELAKKYHPDTGGNGQQFIKLMDVYGALTQG